MCLRNVKPEMQSWYHFMDHTSIDHSELVGALIGLVGLLGLINSGTKHCASLGGQSIVEEVVAVRLATSIRSPRGSGEE
jgi:hypothetical protein